MKQIKKTTKSTKKKLLKFSELENLELAKQVDVIADFDDALEEPTFDTPPKESFNEFKPSLFLKKQAELISPILHTNKANSVDDSLKYGAYLNKKNLVDLIYTPHLDTYKKLTNLVSLDEVFPEIEAKNKSNAEVDYVEIKRILETKEAAELERQKQLAAAVLNQEKLRKAMGNVANCHITPDLFTKDLPYVCHKEEVKKVLILTDTDYQQTTKTYNELIRFLRSNGIMYVEYTNIQPDMTKHLINKVSTFAKNHGVDSLFVFGSWPLVDFSKLVAKALSGSLNSLNTMESSKVRDFSYLIVSIPTVVCMEDGINACTVFKHHANTKNKKPNTKVSINDATSLTVIDNSDYTFFYPKLFLELSTQKLKEVLVESYFRTIQNFFDPKINDDVQNLLVSDAKFFRHLLRHLQKENHLSYEMIEKACHAIARNVDGTTFLSDAGQWRWFLLESSLSSNLNSARSDGLALFAPGYIEYESQVFPKFEKRCKILARKLFDRETVKGLTFELMRFNEEFKLPQSFFDIAQMQRIDSSVLLQMTKKGGNSLFLSYRSAKRIVESISLY